MNMPEKWIWLPKSKYPTRQTTNYSGFDDVTKGNYTVAEFSKIYEFDKIISNVKLRFSGDSAFCLYCNNKFIATGPVCVGGDFLDNDKPRPNFYSNVVEFSPNSTNLAFFSRVRMVPTRMSEYSKGHGGFMLSGLITFKDGTKTVITTDKTWNVRVNEAYIENDKFDSRNKGCEFVKAEEIDNIWHTITAPIPVCVENKVFPQNSKITVLPNEKKNIVLTFDKIYCGFLRISIKNSGLCYINAHCHETDISGITEELIFDGSNEYRGLTMHSANEIALEITNYSDTNAEIEVYLMYTHYPVYETAITKTSNDEINQILETCRHTLKICRQTHHLDSTAHSEPLACTGDYYIETLMTMFSYGDMRLSEFDIIRTAELLRNNDGQMFHTTYSLIWVLMLYDTYMITGNKNLLFECEDALIMLLNRFETYMGENGIIDNPPDYMFIDWIYLDDLSMHHPPKALGQTCLNMFYFGALETASKIFVEIGENAMAKECQAKKENLRLRINELLFDKEKRVYFEGLNTKTDERQIYQYLPQNVSKRYYLKHSNILAAYFGLCDKELAIELIDKVMVNEIKGNYQPYFAHYLLEAIYKNGLRDKYTIEEISKWKKPVLDFPGGLVEGFYAPGPGYGFDHSHAWGGTPLYSLPKALLGFEINKPGMSEITVNPSLLGLQNATVELPTQYGKMIFEIKDDNKISVTAPKDIKVNIKKEG